jgi:hypothetical protein
MYSKHQHHVIALDSFTLAVFLELLTPYLRKMEGLVLIFAFQLMDVKTAF